jgi:hypothetical protein
VAGTTGAFGVAIVLGVTREGFKGAGLVFHKEAVNVIVGDAAVWEWEREKSELYRH